eukprot:81838-Chlamydomonas_euryale.AAC.2
MDFPAKKFGCIPWTREQDPVTRDPRRYQVIGTRSIRAWEYIAPTFVQELGSSGEVQHFHVSPFKWDHPLSPAADPHGISGFWVSIR